MESILRQAIEKLSLPGRKGEDLRGGAGDRLIDERPDAVDAGSDRDQHHRGEAPLTEAPAVRLTETLFNQAISQGASDIHIEPRADGVSVRLRVDGTLRLVEFLPFSHFPSLVSRIKIMADMNIAERRMPQDGRICFRSGEREADFRVSTMPTVFGEKVAIRVLRRNAIPLGLGELGFSAVNLNLIKNILARPYGMILVTGPTGSGKTTSLYAMLAEVSNPERNVVTIEDPVECVLPNINQTQINPAAGLTFAAGLRSILRQDPDVIMVGEIRDSETAAIAVRAATTGHLVLSTMHTNDAAGALTRLIDLGVEPFLVASAVLGVVAQRLVRKVCPRCSSDTTLEPSAAAYAILDGRPGEQVQVRLAHGCEDCGLTGYAGRTSIQEVLSVGPAISDLILRKVPSGAIKLQAIKEGMVPLITCGAEKCRAGITTVDELFRIQPGESVCSCRKTNQRNELTSHGNAGDGWIEERVRSCRGIERG